MIKMGSNRYEWVLLHIRNGEQFVGLVDIPGDLNEEDKLYARCMAADLMQSKVKTDTALDPEMDEIVDRIIELRNPHQVMTGMSQAGTPTVACLPLNLGDKIIFLRAGEVLYAQFLDDKSQLVIQIRKGMIDIVDPGAGEGKTAGGIIIPGQGARPA